LSSEPAVRNPITGIGGKAENLRNAHEAGIVRAYVRPYVQKNQSFGGRNFARAARSISRSTARRINSTRVSPLRLLGRSANSPTRYEK